MTPRPKLASTALAALVLVSAAVPSVAHAELTPDEIPGHPVTPGISGAVIAGGLGIGLAMQLVPIRTRSLWRTELVGSDDDVHANFSTRAAHLSDGLLAASLAAPVFYLMGGTVDDGDSDRLLIYGESVAVNTLIAGVVKRLVQRPRPYLYSKDPAVQRYARAEGDDAYLSFYSGHAALSFGAAVTGAYLVSASGAGPGARAAAWGGGLAVAAATANLRVRAGKHFYSDVVFGGLVGVTVGYLVPALHATATPVTPSGEEIAAGVGGLFAGLLVSQLLPMPHDSPREVVPATAGLLHRLRDVRLSPMPVSGGFGFAIGGGM